MSRTERYSASVLVGLTLWLCPAVWATPAMTPSSPVCPKVNDLMDKNRYLRALSLDLRGDIPTFAEIDALQGVDQVPSTTIDAMFVDFAQEAVRRHRDLLWNSIVNVRLQNNNTTLRKSSNLYWRGGGSLAINARGDRVPCNDKPATWDTDGQLIYEDMDDGTKREGYLLVSPYWAPTTQIKVCAYDAQSISVTASGKTCGMSGTYSDPQCGCGPELRWCFYGSSVRTILEAMAQSLESSVAEMIDNDRPYTDLFTNTSMYVNGPMVHFFKYQRHQTRVTMSPAPFDVDLLPQLQFTDIDKWVKINAGKQHAGILTHPAYLLRYQTNRARASRFYETFLCQPFTAPDTGIDVAGVAAVSEPDLQKRSGCKYCHALLEPVAAFWGHWVESGAAFLDPASFPEFRPDCEVCAKTGQQCSSDCNKYYMIKALTEKEKAFFGMLNSYVFLQPTHKHHVTKGPRLMALAAVADNRMPQCVAKTTAQWLLGRPIVSYEQAWVDELAIDFVKNGYRYRDLVRAIVTSKTYRRVR